MNSDRRWLLTTPPSTSSLEMAEMKGKLEQPVVDADGKWMYVVPDAGFCIKCHSTDKRKKIFINVCQHAAIAEPAPIEQSVDDDDFDKSAIKYRIPLSCGSGRPDTDKSGKPCTVYDVIVNPLTIKRCGEEHEFRRFVAALCMTWLKQKSEPELDADQFVNVNIKCKGRPEPQRVRLATAAQVASAGSNAMGDEIQLPPSKAAAAAPSRVPAAANVGGGGKSGKLVVEVDVPPPSATHTIEHSAEPYDWSQHARPSKNPYFRESAAVPERLIVNATLPQVQTIGEVEVKLTRKCVEFIFVDNERGEPFYAITLPFPVADEPLEAKFVRKNHALRLVLRVALPDEVKEEESRVAASKAAQFAEEESERLAKLERDAALNEYRAKQKRIEDSERAVLEERKEIVANMNAVSQGAVPPALQQEVDAMPPDTARAMMLRLENRIKKGDDIDKLIDSLPQDIIDAVTGSIRKRLGLAPLKSLPTTVIPPPVATAPAGATSSSSATDHEFNFSKKAENLFGVKMNNRYVFALDH